MNQGKKERARWSPLPPARKPCLKPLELPHARQGLFPRSKERGLIEAFPNEICGRYRRRFPRSKERGLIEAARMGEAGR